MKKTLAFRIQLWMALFVCRLLMMTWRIRFIGVENKLRSISENPNGSFIIASFHENAIAGVLSHPGENIHCLASRSKDGAFVAFICEHIGLGAVRGSSSRGGKEAREELIDLLKRGISGAITVDGPKGPRGIPKAGIVDVARKSGAAILGISAIADRCWVLKKTWDQTRVPKPFARILVSYSPPLFVDEAVSSEDFEKIRLALADQMKKHDQVIMAGFEDLYRK